MKRWEAEGLDTSRLCENICGGFGLDVICMINCSAMDEVVAFPNGSGMPVIYNQEDYSRISNFLYTDGQIEKAVLHAEKLKKT